jgi:hypothetical protein
MSAFRPESDLATRSAERPSAVASIEDQRRDLQAHGLIITWSFTASCRMRESLCPNVNLSARMSALGQVPTSRATIESVCFVPFSRHSPRTDSAPFVAKRGHLRLPRGSGSIPVAPKATRSLGRCYLPVGRRFIASWQRTAVERRRCGFNSSSAFQWANTLI